MRGVIRKAVLCIVFVVILAGLLLLSSHILTPKNNDREGGIIDPAANGVLSEPPGTIDVLVIGDSEAYCTVMPLKIWKEHGITTYCCATSGQRLSYSEQFVYKVFENQHPVMVFLETNTIFRKVTFEEALNNKAEAYFPVITYHNRWKTLSTKDLKNSVSYDTVEDGKGYFYSKKIVEADTEGYMEESEDFSPISSRNRHYVEKINEFCENNGAKLVLLSTPSTVNWNYKRHNSITRLAGEMDVEYIDMNTLQEEIPIDWAHDSRDEGDHLNDYGAEKATAYLGDYLEKTGLLTDHRGDAAYAGWNESAAKH